MKETRRRIGQASYDSAISRLKSHASRKKKKKDNDVLRHLLIQWKYNKLLIFSSSSGVRGISRHTKGEQNS